MGTYLDTLVRERSKASQRFGDPNPEIYTSCTPTFHIPNPYNGWQPKLQMGYSYQRMFDVRDGRKFEFNPCFHERWSQVVEGPLTIPYKLNFSPSHYVSFEKKEVNAVEACRAVCLDSISGSYLDDFGARALKTFIAPLPDGSSIINMVLEVIQMLEGNIKMLKKKSSEILEAIKRFHRFLITHPGQFWLAWRFAIRPMLKDIENLIHSWERAWKALNELRKINHRETKRYYREIYRGNDVFSHYQSIAFHWQCLDGNWDPDPEDPDMLPTFPAGVPGPFGLGILPDSDKSTITLCACAVVRFDINDNIVKDSIQTVGLAWQSMQYLFNPWEITWEAIPFSWLIDWCLSEKAKLERWVQEHETSDPFSLGKVLASCWSVKGDMLYDLVGTDDHSTEAPPYTYFGRGRYKWYDRRIGLPDMGSPALRIPFTGYQASILASILEGRLRRR